MVIHGEIIKEGSTYSATMIESIGAYGEGRTRRAACEALVEMVHAIAAFQRPLDGFKASVIDTGDATILLSSNDPARLVSLLLRHQRTMHRLSLADVAATTGAKSRNSYAVYEQGETDPSVGKLQALLDVVAPELALAIIPRKAQVIATAIAHGDDKELDALLADPSPAKVAALRAKTSSKRSARKAG